MIELSDVVTAKAKEVGANQWLATPWPATQRPTTTS